MFVFRFLRFSSVSSVSRLVGWLDLFLVDSLHEMEGRIGDKL